MSDKPSLSFFFSRDITIPLLEKSFFGGVSIWIGRLIFVGTYLYQTGAVIGRAKRDKMPILAKMLSEPGREEDVSVLLQREAAQRLEGYKARNGGSLPSSFFSLILDTELSTEAKIILDQGPLSALKKMLKTKVPIVEAETTMRILSYEGIGFGVCFPDLAKTMYEDTNEHAADRWTWAREQGLELPEKPTIIPFPELEQDVLAMLESYVGTYYPQLSHDLDFLK